MRVAGAVSDVVWVVVKWNAVEGLSDDIIGSETG
jgi:hypothetical protein